MVKSYFDLFNYNECQKDNNGNFIIFYNCVLTKNIFDYPIKSRIDMIFHNYVKKKLVFFVKQNDNYIACLQLYVHIRDDLKL